VTATTAGAGNTPVSIAEDIVATVMSFLAILIPLLVGAILIIALSLFIVWYSRRENKNAV
jgi:hypothetical protein